MCVVGGVLEGVSSETTKIVSSNVCTTSKQDLKDLAFS